MTYIAKITTPAATYYPPFDAESHQWEVYSGYEPKIQEWLVPAEMAAAVMADIAGLTAPANELSLTLGETGNTFDVLRVVCLGVAPAENTQKRYLLFTDVRWYLTFAILNFDANVRRRVGNTRLIGDTLTATVVAPTIAYAAWSLNAGAAYDWDNLKTQVLTYLTQPVHGRPLIFWLADTFTQALIASQVCQEVTSDAEGPAGLARAIEAVPGAGIYVDLSGIIHVHERTGGAEAALISQLPPPLMDHGDVALVDMVQVRPAPSAHSYRVYVDLEIEVRLDYDVSATVGTNTPYLVPVLQVTDPSLTIPAGTYMLGVRTSSNNVVGQGSWIGQDEAFAAWGSKVVGALTLPQLTDTIVANHYAGHSLSHYSSGGSYASFDPLWDARINELLRCWRTFFQVNPQFWGLVRHAWNVRAAVWDPVTGTRAPSPVYSNYSVMLIDPGADTRVYYFGRNLTTSYPATPGDLNTGNPSGFRMEIEDEELGILRVERTLAHNPESKSLLPSPVVDMAQLADDTTTLKEVCLQQLVPANQWKLATVLSLSPASPNDLRRMYEIQVSLAQASTAAGLVTPVTTGAAPDQELRTRIADARIPWVDSTGANNLNMLGVPDTSPEISNQDPVSAVPPINLTQELRPLANAIAAADLVKKLDHYEGTRAVQAVPDGHKLHPLGSIVSVVHKADDGRFVSVIHCTPHQKSVPAENFLTGAARSYLLKQIQAVR